MHNCVTTKIKIYFLAVHNDNISATCSNEASTVTAAMIEHVTNYVTNRVARDATSVYDQRPIRGNPISGTNGCRREVGKYNLDFTTDFGSI